jgi:hypothetical protein
MLRGGYGLEVYPIKKQVHQSGRLESNPRPHRAALGYRTLALACTLLVLGLNEQKEKLRPVWIPTWSPTVVLTDPKGA